MKKIKTLGMVTVVTAMLSGSVFAANNLTDSTGKGIVVGSTCVETLGGNEVCGSQCFTFSGDKITSHCHGNALASESASNYSGAKKAAVKDMIKRHGM